MSRYDCSPSLHSRGGTAIEHVRNLGATVELDTPCTSHLKANMIGELGDGRIGRTVIDYEESVETVEEASCQGDYPIVYHK